MGVPQTLMELKERASKAGYPEFVGGGISRFNGLINRNMAGEWFFKNSKGDRYMFVVQGLCDQCRAPLARWVNWYMAKEYDETLEAECANTPGHLVMWDDLGDARMFDVLWEGVQKGEYSNQLAEIAKVLKDK